MPPPLRGARGHSPGRGCCRSGGWGAQARQLPRLRAAAQMCPAQMCPAQMCPARPCTAQLLHPRVPRAEQRSSRHPGRALRAPRAPRVGGSQCEMGCGALLAAPGARGRGTGGAGRGLRCPQRSRGWGGAGMCGTGWLQAELRPSAQLTLFLLGLNDSCRALDTFNPVFMDEIL